MAGFNVSGLTDYVKQNQDLILKNVVFPAKAGDTIARMAAQVGVKKTERLNYLNVDPALQDGSNCGFNASGSTEFSERDITVAAIKVQDQYCDRDLIGKWTEYQVKTGANKDAADLPFEEVIMGEVVNGINQKLEKLVWQGATSGTVSGGTDLVDGLITLAEEVDSASTVNVSFASGDTMYAKIKAMIAAIPEAIVDKAVVFVSPANFRTFVLEMVEKNFYHFAPGAEIEDKDIIFPGTNIKIHKTVGLTGSNKIYASAFENMVYGTDLMNDNESVRFWYDENSELFKYSIRWNSGVMTYFPDLVVLGQ